MVPSEAFASQPETRGSTVCSGRWVCWASVSSCRSVYSCVHAHLPQMPWAGRQWASRSYTFKGRDACVLSWPRT